MHDLTHLLGMQRPDLARALAAAVPGIPANEDAIAHAESLWARGGRPAAAERLAALDPAAYARTRNHVAGAVSRLSPWLRHGVVSLAEARDAALGKAGRPEEAAKFIAELGWRDYWRRVHARLGDRIGEPIEMPAHPSRHGLADAMPADVLGAATGMACIDAFVRRLRETGWLHNHERMWLASWLVHVRGVAWRTGADWMLGQLLDGDPASNHLSWQWVAGTFSAKPYLFNRENLESFTGGIHCRPCGLRGICDVEGSYEELTARHLAAGSPQRPPLRIPPAAEWPSWPAVRPTSPLVWLTLDSVSSASPAAAAFPDAPRVFVVDPTWLAEERPSLSRLLFLFECLADVPRVEVLLGSPTEVVADRLRRHRRDGVAVAETPCPRVRHAAARIRDACSAGTGGPSQASAPLPVCVLRWPDFCDARTVRDLGRFSRYWQQVGPSAFVTTGSATTPDAGRRE
ncbi:MAG: FAD-binding domain-containing protein [Planctomycetia bacterium]